MLNSIPKSRLLMYSLFLGLVPIIFVLIFLLSELSELNELENSLHHIEQLVFSYEKKQVVNNSVRSHFQDADHFYIDKNLETLVFLEPESESLQKIMSNKNFPDDEVIKKRYEFINGPANSLIFSEGIVQTHPLFQETTETLVHPVEVNIEDLKKILAKIEGLNIGHYSPGPNRPQLIILDFKIDKKSSSDQDNEVFLLNLKLLKREFL